jgi:glycosyltransferase involved in cell wall biosynthesis
MQILQVTAAYPPTLGGVERHVAELSRALTEQGHSVEVVSHDRARGGRRRENDHAVLVVRFRPFGPAAYSFSLPLIWYVLRRQAPWDVIHAHSYHRLTSGVLAVLARTPIVFTTHYHGTGHTRVARHLHKVYRFFSRIALARASAIIAVSAAERSLLVADFPFVAGKTSVIPNGTSRPAPPADDAPGQPARNRSVLAAGRLEPYKGIDQVLAALEALPDDVDLTICGNGPDRPRLEALAGELGITERVSFRGRVSDAELADRLSRCGVVVTLSRHEAFGMTVAEALVAGSPVVCSDIPAFAEFTAHAPAGAVTLVPPGCPPEEVASAILRALEHGPVDPTKVDLPDWAQVARQTESVYESVRG